MPAKKRKISAIVPALNEEANVGAVLKVLLKAEILNEVILVDDGSTDKTAEIGKKLGAKIVKLSKKGGSGKGNALKQGLKVTNAEIIAFFDADLIGLNEEHVNSLVQPVLAGKAVMCVGIRDRLFGLPENISKIDPLLAVGGERVIERKFLEKIPEEHFEGFAIETAINHYCLANKLKVEYVLLNKLTHVLKEKKWGIVRGFFSRIKMILQIIKIRLILIFKKNEFIQENNAE